MPIYYNGRLTTEETEVWFRPGPSGGYADANHVQHITIPAAISAGEFRLRINGHETAPIDTQAADLVVALDAAIDALVDTEGNAVFATADVVVASEGSDVYSLTFAAAYASQPMVVEVFSLAGDTAVVGGTILNAVDTQGGGLIQLTGGLMSINTSLTQETVDMTAMGETTRARSTTVQDGSFDMRVFHASQDYLVHLRPGSEGLLTVYERGVGAGLPYFSFPIIIEQSDVSREAFDKIEVSLSGSQQGAPVNPFGSFQPAS